MRRKFLEWLFKGMDTSILRQESEKSKVISFKTDAKFFDYLNDDDFKNKLESIMRRVYNMENYEYGKDKFGDFTYIMALTNLMYAEDHYNDLLKSVNELKKEIKGIAIIQSNKPKHYFFYGLGVGASKFLSFIYLFLMSVGVCTIIYFIGSETIISMIKGIGLLFGLKE